MSLILLSLGGSGERVMRSAVMLLAAGMRLKDSQGADMSLKPVFLDTDTGSQALTDAQNIINNYRQLQAMFENLPWGKATDRTLFQAKIEEPVMITIDGNTMGCLNDLINANNFDEDKKAELSILFSSGQLGLNLGMGFIGMPNLGTIALNYLVSMPTFNNVLNNLQNGDKILFVSSIFGGTGASGFPLILNKLQNLDIIRQDNNQIALGTVTMLPYFKFSNEVKGQAEMHIGDNVFTVDSDEFDSKTFAAFKYYDTNLNKNRISSQYFIGNPDKSIYPKCLGGKDQANPAHLLEVLCATSLFHFAEHAEPRNENNPNIFYYENWSGKDGSHDYDLSDIDVPELKKALVRMQMFEYVLRNELRRYTLNNPQVVADHYDFSAEDCRQLKAMFTPFMNSYDLWRNELNDQSHTNSMKFQYYRGDPQGQQFITECFNPSIAATHSEGCIRRRDVVSEPDFLNKMSAAMANYAGKGWDPMRKKQFTLYLIMTAVEKVISQEKPYSIVKL